MPQIIFGCVEWPLKATNLWPDAFEEGEELVLAVGAEDLDGDRLKQVPALVNLSDGLVRELADDAFADQPVHLA